MKVAIMQPYFFPYIGYFQLINAVDTFVIYDDVNFKKQSWITRNRILLDHKAFNLILQVQGASSFKKINHIEIGTNTTKLIKTLEQAYKDAPFFDVTFPIIKAVFLQEEPNLSKFLIYSIKTIANYLEIRTDFKISSNMDKDIHLKGQDKVFAICKTLGASHYINAIGGQELYDREVFKTHSIDLSFVETNAIHYAQFDKEFIPWLSIIDVMMFNTVEDIKKMLNQYVLI